MDKEGYRRFIEEAADLIDEHGLPRMAGRVIGALLVCVPPHLSLDQLAEDVQSSRGAISMATQLLIRLGFIERISLSGERRYYYRLRPGFLEDMMTDRTEHMLRHHQLFERGIELLRDEPIEAKARLIEMQAYMDFLVEELPGLSERWTTRRDELIRKRSEEMA
jgi:DNA-binding transcriptional regulator GbsR (MarR family)